MTATTPKLRWSESEPPAEVHTGDQLDALLDRLTAAARPDFPISVRLQAHDCSMDILLGLPESFVYLDEVSPRRYYITVGDSYIDGVVRFHLLGQHHTEFERRHLIPLVLARSVIREFFDTGRRPASVEWEDGSY
jgi:immunity protein Imm1 of predicted polymorphic toxin system